MKPKHLKEQRLKKVRGIIKKREELYTAIYNLGYKPLDKPIRHGWFKEIQIHVNVNRYKNEKAIRELFDCVQKRYWGRTKEEANRRWLAQVSEYLIYKEFPTISKKQFNRLTPKAQAMCTVFRYKLKYSHKRQYKTRFYVRIPKSAYTIKYTRAYITHSKIIDPELESQVAILNQQLLKHGFYEAEQKINRWKDYWNITDYKKDRRKTKSNLSQLKIQY